MTGTRKKRHDRLAATPSGQPPPTAPGEPAGADLTSAPYWPRSFEEMAEAYELGAQLMQELAKEAAVLRRRRQPKS